MGLGDQLLATGMARGAKARGKRIAFGDGEKIRWDHNSEQVFRRNPNVAPPGSERADDLEWIAYYKGHRIYNEHDRAGGRWIWNLDFRPTPGELYLGPEEVKIGRRFGDQFVLIEPNVEDWKPSAQNKDWGRERYQAVADELRRQGYRLAQFRYKGAGPPLTGVEQFTTMNFRDAMAILSHAAIYVGPEGGTHHGAAAMGVEGVVIFGGFIPPSVTGYDLHTNLTGGAEACGSLSPCRHCKEAMRAISVEEVVAAAEARL